MFFVFFWICSLIIYYYFVNADKNIQRRSQTKSWFAGLEQSHPYIRGMDGKIINRDVRVRSHIVKKTYMGHKQEVCGLKWSDSGQRFASGGNDNHVYIWDRSLASSNTWRQWLHKLEDRTAPVRALAWCPFQNSLLVSGGVGVISALNFGTPARERAWTQLTPGRRCVLCYGTWMSVNYSALMVLMSISSPFGNTLRWRRWQSSLAILPEPFTWHRYQVQVRNFTL